MQLSKPVCGFCLKQTPELETTLLEKRGAEVIWRQCSCMEWNVVSDKKPERKLVSYYCWTPACNHSHEFWLQEPGWLGSEIRVCQGCNTTVVTVIHGDKIKWIVLDLTNF